jgi:hypothetical protein
MPSTDFSIQVPSDDPKKKNEKGDDKDKKEVASKLKDDSNGDGEELVRANLSSRHSNINRKYLSSLRKISSFGTSWKCL